MTWHGGGLRAFELARLFLRAWQLRFAAIIVATAILAIAVTGVVTSSLQLSPQQRADSALGTADARIQLPSGVAIGTDGRDLDDRLRAAVVDAGGSSPSIDYGTAGLYPEDYSEKSIAFREIDDRAVAAPQIMLRSGAWPTHIGEALVSEALAGRWPVGGTVQLFGGALSLTVVGEYRDVFNTSARSFVVPAGTWSSMRALDAATAARLDDGATREVRWSGDDSIDAVTAAVGRAVGEDPTTLDVHTRAAIERSTRSTDVTLTVALIAGPLAAGLIAGLLAGGFTRRSRDVMWTIGVPYASTRAAAALAVAVVAAAGGVAGAAVGMGAAVAGRPLIAEIATQPLGPITSLPGTVAAIALAIVGALGGAGLADRRRSSARRSARSRSRTEHILVRLCISTVVLAAGLAIGNGTTSRTEQMLSALLIAIAILVAATPAAIALVSRWTPEDLGARLGVRLLGSDRRSSSVIVWAVASLQVIGIAAAVVITSFVTNVNAATESVVAPGQIVLEVELDDDVTQSAVRAEVESLLGVTDPVVATTLNVGSDRGAGASRTVATASDLERLLARSLTQTERETLESGGYLLTKEPASPTVSFLAEGGIAASFTAVVMDDIDPSWRNVDGFLLVETARAAGLPLSPHPALIFTDTTPAQREAARTAAATLSFNPSWLRVYREPDELAAPLQVSALTTLVSAFAGVVLLATASAQARALRPQLAGLRALGVGGGFLARTVGTRVGATFVLSTALALCAASIGVAVSFALAQLDLGITVPIIPTSVMVGTLAVFSWVAARLSTRRLRSSEWQT